jgi:hypothetical protein
MPNKHQDLEQEVERLAHLFSGLDHYVEQVAEQYAESRKKFGIQLERKLEAKGYDRAWQTSLFLIGTGRSAAGILRLDPAKRALLELLAPSEQRRILREGVNGKPCDSVPLDVFRASISGMVPRASKIPVRAHPRKFPVKDNNPEAWLLIGKRKILWSELINALERASVADQIPARVAKQVIQACKRVLKKT